MIDTIILRLKEFDFHIENYGAFSPHCLHFFRNPSFNGANVLKATQNPTNLDKEALNYKPRLTVLKRLGRKVELKIEFSVPKLLYGNNFQEVTESDFAHVLGLLQQKLKEMYVKVDLEILRKADVLGIHYGKNFVFKDHTTASSLITDIGKVDLTRRLDLNKSDFRNAGKALYYYAKSHSLVFYDKIADLNQPTSRATEKDSSYNFQSNIFDEIRRTQKVPVEVLRMEVRLCTRIKMKQLFKYLHHETPELTFEGLFKKNLAQGVCLDYWCKLHDEVRASALTSRSQMDVLEAILKKTDITLQQSLNLFVFVELCKTYSEREVFDAIGSHSCSRTAQRLKKMFRDNRDKIIFDRYTVFDQIYEDLQRFEPVYDKDILEFNS